MRSGLEIGKTLRLFSEFPTYAGPVAHPIETKHHSVMTALGYRNGKPAIRVRGNSGLQEKRGVT